MSETTTLTQAEHDTAVAAAVAEAVKPLAELRAELDALKSASAAAETDQRVADLQSELDTLVAEKAAAETQLAAVTEYLANAAAEAAHAAEVAARVDARAAEVTEIGLLPAEHIETAKARWAELDDDAWTDKVAEYRAIATAHNVTAGTDKPKTPVDVPGKPADPPAPSPLTATAGSDKAEGRAFDSVFALRANGVDLTTHVH